MATPEKKPAAPVIKMTSAKSSNIASHGYDAATKTLAIQFANGGLYHYANVPPEKADALSKAKSAGGFFASDIRNAFKGVKQAHRPKPRHD